MLQERETFPTPPEKSRGVCAAAQRLTAKACAKQISSGELDGNSNNSGSVELSTGFWVVF